MKPNEEVMEILEAFDLTGSFRAAARLAGCDPKTVARYVALRGVGKELDTPARNSIAAPFLDKIEELVERSKGDVRADVVHDKLRAMGYEGSERTTRRAVATAKEAYERGHRRIFRPWVPEPGLWFQWDWGQGPSIWGRDTQLWVRVARVVALSGHHPDVGQDAADGDRVHRRDPEVLRRRPDLRADR